MIRSVHNSRGAVSSPMPAFLVFRYIVTQARYKASRWFMSSGRPANSTAATSMASSANARHTASLVAKYRLKVRGDTSAIAAICSTVVCSNP